MDTVKVEWVYTREIAQIAYEWMIDDDGSIMPLIKKIVTLRDGREVSFAPSGLIGWGTLDKAAPFPNARCRRIHVEGSEQGGARMSYVFAAVGIVPEVQPGEAIKEIVFRHQ